MINEILIKEFFKTKNRINIKIRKSKKMMSSIIKVK